MATVIRTFVDPRTQNVPVRCAGLLFMLGLAAVMPTHAQTPEARVLAARISPGTIAQLVRLPPSEAAHQRLSEAARHGDGHVRGAAARVVFAGRRAALVPALLAAFERETDASARFEQARAVACLGDEDHTRRLLERWEVTRDIPTLFGLAAGRGVSTLELLPRVRELVSSAPVLAEFLALATRLDTGALTQVADTARRRADDVLFEAVLSAARAAQFEMPARPIADVLRQGVDSPLAAVALWYVLTQWSDVSGTLPETLTAALSDTLPRDIGEDVAPETRVAHELVSRALGRQADTGTRWAAALRDPSAMTPARVDLAAVRALLRPDELSALAATHRVEIRSDPGPDSVLVGRSPTALDPSFSTVAGYPDGFVSSVFKAANCSLAGAAEQGAGGAAADVVFDVDGRALQIRIVDTGASPNCMEAALVLFASYVLPQAGVTGAGKRALLMVPFDTDFAACHDVPLEVGSMTALSTPAVLGKRREIQLPRKVRDRKPIYPPQMQLERRTGPVMIEAIVTSTGCVQSARVLRSLHAQLDWSAIRAVSAWRFTPAQLDGKVTPVIMSVTVNFRL